MNKKTLMLCISAVVVLLLLLGILLTVLLIPKKENNETVETPVTIEEGYFYGETPLAIDGQVKYELFVSDLKNTEKPLLTITIYNNKVAILNKISENGKVFSNVHVLSDEEYTNINIYIEQVKKSKTVDISCTEGYLYTIKDNQDTKSYQSCGNCNDEIMSCYTKIKNMLN